MLLTLHLLELSLSPLAFGIPNDPSCCPSLRHRNKPLLRSCHTFSFLFHNTKAFGLPAVSSSPTSSLPFLTSSLGEIDHNQFYSRPSRLPLLGTLVPRSWYTCHIHILPVRTHATLLRVLPELSTPHHLLPLFLSRCLLSPLSHLILGEYSACKCWVHWNPRSANCRNPCLESATIPILTDTQRGLSEFFQQRSFHSWLVLA